MSDVFTAKEVSHKYYDAVIIGAGGAGLYSAYLLSKLNNKTNNKPYKIAILNKNNKLIESNTAKAQGGINAVFPNNPNDKWTWHMQDTLNAAKGLANREMVEYMCKNAHEAIVDLQNIGVNFDVDENNNIKQKKYGGQKLYHDSNKIEFAKRACYSKDQTGYSIMSRLTNLIENDANIDIYNNFFAISLDVDHNNLTSNSVFAINKHANNQDNKLNDKFYYFHGKDIILAGGGFCNIFQFNSSPYKANGDVIATAKRANLMIKDMEFIQFHPTILHNTSLLISEAARSKGGILLNSKMERFMQKYDKDMMELATRDVITKAMFNEIESGMGASKNKDHLWLDLRHIPENIIKSELPNLYKNTKNHNINPATDLIPVSPGAHYNMGGIAVNHNMQILVENNNVINNLFAIGEAACISIHGASRLGCNSLLELFVFAKKLAQYISTNKKSDKDHSKDTNKNSNLNNIVLDKYIANYDSEHNSSHDANIMKKLNKIEFSLKEIMQKKVAIYRKKEKLLLAEIQINKLSDMLSSIKINKEASCEMIEYLITIDNMLLIASLVIKAAINRKKSIGAHYIYSN